MREYTFNLFHTLIFTPLRKKEVVNQIYLLGLKSAPIILFSVSFAAAVTILEYSYHMKLVIQTASMVPGFASLLIFRELGAVLTALLLTSRVGAGMASELATMEVTEQIEALELLQISPYSYLVVPRLIATTLSSMALCVLANATCLLFSMIVSIQSLGLSVGTYISSMNRFISFKDLIFSIIKAAFFGVVIPFISCFYGLNCKSGAEGVGRATTQAVVVNALTIIIIDFVLTWLFSYFY